MSCIRSEGEPPSVCQWVWHTSVWRVYWPCGCAMYVQGEIGKPPVENYVEADSTRDGSGMGDPYHDAWVEALNEDTRH